MAGCAHPVRAQGVTRKVSRPVSGYCSHCKCQGCRLTWINSTAAPPPNCRGMKQPEDDQGKQLADPESPPQAEPCRSGQEYIDDLRELIRKLRRKLH